MLLSGIDVLLFHLDNPVPGNEPLQSDYITVDVEDPLYYEQYLAWEKEWLAYKDKVAEFETGDRLDGRHSLSPNGKYMCTYMIKNDYTDVPVRIDIEQGTMKVLEELGSGIALSVTNDGNMTVGEPVVSAIRSGYIYLSKQDKLVAMEEWIQDEFGYDMIHGENGIASISGEFEQSASWVMNQEGSRMYGYIGGLPYLTYNFRMDLPSSLDVLKIDPAQVRDGKFVYVNGELQFADEVDHVSICSLSGIVLYKANNVGTAVELNLPQGVYVVKVISQGASSTGKIIVK